MNLPTLMLLKLNRYVEIVTSRKLFASTPLAIECCADPRWRSPVWVNPSKRSKVQKCHNYYEK